MSDTDRAISRLFVPGKDGFDYYPFGFRRGGYPVDGTLLEDAVAIERSGSRFALIGIGLVALLLYVVLPKMAEANPGLIPLANSPIIRLAIALPSVALVYLAVMARRRTLLGGLLAGRAATSLPLSAQAILARRAQHWRMTPWFSRAAAFVAIPLAALAMTLYATERAGQEAALAPWEAGSGRRLRPGTGGPLRVPHLSGHELSRRGLEWRIAILSALLAAAPGDRVAALLPSSKKVAVPCDI